MSKFHFSLRPLSLIAGLAISAAALPSPSFATDVTTTFTVNATVAPSCLVAATNLNFGAYNGTVNNATNTITATCTLGTDYTIALDGGGSGDVTARRMTGLGNADLLNYGLYTTVGHTTIWGDGTGGTQTVSGTGSGVAQNITDFGQIPASQNVSVDTYQDTINVTLTY